MSPEEELVGSRNTGGGGGGVTEAKMYKEGARPSIANSFDLLLERPEMKFKVILLNFKRESTDLKN